MAVLEMPAFFFLLDMHYTTYSHIYTNITLLHARAHAIHITRRYARTHTLLHARTQKIKRDGRALLAFVNVPETFFTKQ